MEVIRKRNGKLYRIKKKPKISVGDRLHENFYDDDGTLKLSSKIDKEFLGPKRLK